MARPWRTWLFVPGADAAAHATLVLAQRKHPIVGAAMAEAAVAQKLAMSSMEYKGHRLQK